MTVDDGWPPLGGAIPADPYDEDRYCVWCGNGDWKPHAPECAWADASDDVDPVEILRKIINNPRIFEPSFEVVDFEGYGFTKAEVAYLESLTATP